MIPCQRRRNGQDFIPHLSARYREILESIVHQDSKIIMGPSDVPSCPKSQKRRLCEPKG